MIRATQKIIKHILYDSRFVDVVKHSPLYGPIQWIQLQDWKNRGRPIPPPSIVKQRAVREYAARFSLNVLIETGTYMGYMVDATMDTFIRIFTIELNDALFERARKRFARFAHITVIQGDSGKVLPNILANITQPCLFWLDAHHTFGTTAEAELETPIVQELRHILGHPADGHVILIDDARLFIGQNDYPALEDLRASILVEHPEWVFDIQDDVIRIYKLPSS